MASLRDLTDRATISQARATYGENLAAGDNVKLNSSGELVKWGAGTFNTSLTTSQVKSTFDGTASGYTRTAYAKNRSLFFLAVQDNNISRVVVVERSSLTQTITRNEFDVGVSLGGNISGNILSMCFLENENKLIIVSDTSNAYSYSYDNGNLTFDQSVAIGTPVSGPRQGFPVENIGGDDVACFQYEASGILVTVGYVGGTLSTDSVTAVSGMTGGKVAGKWDPVNSKGLACYLKQTGDIFEVATFTVSGVTISIVGTNDTETIDWASNTFDLEFDPVSSTFLAVGKSNSGNNIRYTTIDCSGSDPVIASESDLATGTISTSNSGSHQLVHDPLSGHFLLSSYDPDGANESKVLTLSSGVLTLDNETEFVTTTTTSAGAYTNLFFDEAYQSIVIVFREPASGYEWNMGLGRITPDDELRDFTPDQDNLIGVAMDTKLLGESGRYRLLDKYKGVLIQGLTGLLPGAEYYLQELGGLGTSRTSDFYGLAISATEAVTSTAVGLINSLKTLTSGFGRTLNEYTGSDNTGSGTYTTICDEGGSGVLRSIICSSSNSSAAVGIKITKDGVEKEYFGTLNGNPLRSITSNESKTWDVGLPYEGGIKVEVDSGNSSYTTYATVILEQD